METRISPMAHVESGAKIGNGVQVGPFCFVGPEVEIGDGCVLTSHVVLTGRTKVGQGNRFSSHVVIGGDPQDLSWTEGDTSVEIGDNNSFREGVTVNRGAEKEDGVTRIGNVNLFGRLLEHQRLPELHPLRHAGEQSILEGRALKPH